MENPVEHFQTAKQLSQFGYLNIHGNKNKCSTIILPHTEVLVLGDSNLKKI